MALLSKSDDGTSDTEFCSKSGCGLRGMQRIMDI